MLMRRQDLEFGIAKAHECGIDTVHTRAGHQADIQVMHVDSAA
jgi:hypothetical protein